MAGSSHTRIKLASPIIIIIFIMLGYIIGGFLNGFLAIRFEGKDMPENPQYDSLPQDIELPVIFDCWDYS